MSSCFNPRAHEGRDLIWSSSLKCWVSFNPRAHEGRDLRTREKHRLQAKFQSTRPRGARRNTSVPLSVVRSFNPRAHEGRDFFIPNRLIYKDWFQSTRPRGARLNLLTVRDKSMEFQSTRPRGARQPLPLSVRQRKEVSIHAPTRGATLVIN